MFEWCKSSKIKAIVRAASQVELQKNELITLPPFGTSLFGITLSGNSIIAISADFHTGDEWIRTHAYLTPKGKISFTSKDVEGADIETPGQIKKAFNPLLSSLSIYFPYDKDNVVRLKKY